MPLKSPRFYLIVFLTVCLVDPAWCKIIYVPKDFLTIQTAIENCQNQDQIIVSPGHYRENLRFNGQDIILRSTNPNDLEIVQQTVVDGGGISAVITLSGNETSDCQIAGLTLTNGRKAIGAGISGNGSAATIALNRIIGNRAISDDGRQAHGGAIAQCNGIITSNQILSNWVESTTASGSGGGIYQASGTIVNNIIAGNTVSVLWNASGGGLSTCQADIINNTIAYNRTVTLSALDGYAFGAGISNCNGLIQNCILWDNSPSKSGQIHNSTIPMYSCLNDENGNDNYNIDQDPLFVSETDLRLQAESPCINRGNPKNSPITDLTHYRRTQPDMGAYEWRPTPIVNTLSSELSEGQIWFRGSIDQGVDKKLKAFFEYGPTLNYGLKTPIQLIPLQTLDESVEIQQLMNNLQANTTYHFRLVVVYERGRSYGQDQILMLGQPIVRVPDDYLTIQEAIDDVPNGYRIVVRDGIYSGNLDMKGKSLLLQSENGAESCIINSQAQGRGIIFQTSETNETVIEGFTITNGWADEGGGIACFGSSPIIRDCIVVENVANQYGGGIYCHNAEPILENCHVLQNKGGGIYSLDASPKISHCLIERNITAGDGGGIYCHKSNIQVDSTIIRRNRADYSGGGLYCRDAQPYLVNCIIDYNVATKGGALSANFYALPTLIHCTIVFNQIETSTSKATSGAVYADKTASPRIYNSILWLNGNNPIEFLGDVLQIRYSAVEGGFPNIGNINVIPILADTEQYEYYVSDQSPLIGGGSPDWAATIDFEGNLRANPPTIGAYEIGRYIPDIHLIQTQSDVGSIITPSGEISVRRLENQNFQFTTQAGYQLVDIFVDGNSVGPVESYSLERIKKDHLITTTSISYPVNLQAEASIETYQGEPISIELTLLNIRGEPTVPLSPIRLALDSDTEGVFMIGNVMNPPATELVIPVDQNSATVFFSTHQLGQSLIRISHLANDELSKINPVTHSLQVVNALERIQVEGSPIGIGQTATITLIGKPSKDQSAATFSILGLVEDVVATASQDQPTHYVGYFTPILDQHLKGTYDVVGQIGHSKQKLAGSIELITEPRLLSPQINPRARSGEEIQLSVAANRPGLQVVADISKLDTTQAKPILLEITEEDDVDDVYIYSATHAISYQTQASDGSKTVRFSATDPQGDLATPMLAQVQLKNEVSFELNIPEDVSLIYLPLVVDQVNQQKKTIRQVSDLYEVLSPAVNFLVTYQPETADWVSYFGDHPASSRGDVPITNTTGIIAVMRRPVTLFLTGKVLDHRLRLKGGLNLIGLPRQDPRLTEVGDLIQLDSVGDSITHLIVQSDIVDPIDRAKDQHFRRFLAVAFPDSDGTVNLVRNEPIQAGKGLVMITRGPETIVVQGDPWPSKTNEFSSKSAPTILPVEPICDLILLRGTLPTVSFLSAQSLVVDSVRVVNRSNHLVASSQLSNKFAPDSNQRSTDFSLTLVGLNTQFDKLDPDWLIHQPTQVGDQLEIQIFYADGSTHNFYHSVTATELINRSIDLGPLLHSGQLPSKTQLLGNYPNPFNPETWICYDLANPTQTAISIHNTSGMLIRRVNLGNQPAGTHTYHWDGRAENGELAASGVYFYTFKTLEFESTKKMVILK